MATGPSKHAPNWKLWHPSQGIVFQPLYPVLDVARFFTEASVAREADTQTIDIPTTTVRRYESKTVFTQEAQLRAGGQRGQIAAEEQARGTEIAGNGNLDGVVSERPEAHLVADQTVETSGNAPFTPLEYKVPDEAFLLAKEAAEGSAGSFWSYSLYRGPDLEDGVKGKVRVHYCRNAHTAERELQYLLKEKYIGLDLEWVAQASKYSGARRNVSLVQLASQSRVVLLHLALYPPKDELATPTLRKIIEDPDIMKLGVWIKGDCTRLKNYLGIEARGIFELSHLFKQVRYSTSQPRLVNKRLVPLATQCQEVLGLPMRKESGVRTSDWSQPLSKDQVGYSASDAYAAVHLFAMLNHQREQMDPAPALPFCAELNRAIPLPPGMERSVSEESDLDEDITDEALLEAEGGLASLRAEVLQTIEKIRGSLEEADENSEEIEDDGEVVSSKRSSKKPSAKRKAPTPAPTAPKDPRLETAELRAAEYKESQEGKVKAGPAALKAYFVWDANEGLDCEGIASLLRDPPLQTTTVASYIMSCVKYENLPYDRSRLKTEVAACLPTDVLRRRYFALWRAIN